MILTTWCIPVSSAKITPKEPIMSKPQPQRPFQEMAAYFGCYHAGRFYLIFIVVDCYWPTIIPMGRNITTSYLNAGLREVFSRTAIIPGQIEDHNSPQGNSSHLLISEASTIRPQQSTEQWKGRGSGQVHEENN